MLKGFISTLLLGLTISSFGADWYTWRGPMGNGVSEESGWKTSWDGILWEKELGKGHSTACVKDGRLYTMGNRKKAKEDVVYCLDALDGSEIWTFKYSCKAGNYSGPRATPTFHDGKIYTISRDGLVHCLDADSGKEIWKTDVLKKTGFDNVKWGVACSPVIVEDLILFNMGEGGVALDKNRGKVVWKGDEGKAGYASVVAFEHKKKTCAAIFAGEKLIVVDALNGRELDTYRWETMYDVNGADPLIVEDKIFVSSGYNNGCALLDFSSGKLKKVWKNAALKNHFSSSIYLDGYIYGIDGQSSRDSALRCVDAKTGKEMWSEAIGFGALIAADSKLIILTEEGYLVIVDASPDGYKELSNKDTGLSKTCWAAPVLSNGIIYCRKTSGKMVAIDVRK